MFFKGSLVLGSVGLDLSSRELDLAQHLEQQAQNPTLGYLHWDTSPTSAPACSFAYLRCIQTTIIFFFVCFLSVEKDLKLLHTEQSWYRHH